MLDIFNIEKQANKRVHKYLMHLAKENTTEPFLAKLVINIIIGQVSLHFYQRNTYLKTIDFKTIADYFGVGYDENVPVSVYNYMLELCKENHIDALKINIVICENKQELGAYLYEGTNYKKRISTLDLLYRFYFNH